MKRSLIILITILSGFICKAGNKRAYINALDSLQSLIEMNQPKSFKKAVFIVENTYLNNGIDYNNLNKAYALLSDLSTNWASNNSIPDYNAADSNDMLLNRAIFQIIKDTVRINTNKQIITFLPFNYNFDDYNGKKDWANTFVSMLLSTHKGNCHSLPFLYKILADELGAKCWLVLAPNHIYIRNHSISNGWFNTELTSGDFPVDAWLTATGYIPLQAIQTGLYCDTLSNQQSIGLCVVDLVKGYEKQTHNYNDGFIIKCCDLVLKYHSMNVQALLLKAETLKHVYQQQKKQGNVDAKNTYNDMEKLYINLYNLGYREMPDKMYQNWLFSLQNQKNNYINKKVK